MVFAQLASHEKEAFFSLLDEYFSSRPELLAHASSSEGSAGAAVHRALSSNPEATSRLVSAGLKHGLPSKSGTPASTGSNPQVGSAFGRVAAASAAFTGGNKTPSAPSHGSGSSDSNLTSNRKFGDVDMSSAKNMFGSLRSSTANKSAAPVTPRAPPAFSVKNSFAPPPVRHTPSAEPPTAKYQPPTEEPEEEDEVQGEWAEALYDYNSGDAVDLELHANDRVHVTERTSDDWWTGEVDGRSGLFPAAYVKVL
jgi:hypothetical protein